MNYPSFTQKHIRTRDNNDGYFSDLQRITNDKGNILIICVVILMILTSLGIYALNSTTIELTMAGADRRESSNTQNAEAGLKFAKANFKVIFENKDENSRILYTLDAAGTGIGGAIGPNPTPTSVNPGSIFGTIDPLSPTEIPENQRLPIRDLPLNTGGVIFRYTLNNRPLALIEIRALHQNPTANASMTPIANSIPAHLHLSDPPSGYDPSLFAGRNYIITSTAINAAGATTGTILQAAIRIAALKDQVEHLKNM